MSQLNSRVRRTKRGIGHSAYRKSGCAMAILTAWMGRTRTQQCSTARRWLTVARTSSHVVTGGASTVAGCATTTTTAAMARTKARTAMRSTKRAHPASSRARTSNASGTRIGVTVRTIAATTRTSMDVQRVAETERRQLAALTNSGAPAGSVSTLRWCATRCQTARTTVMSQPTATWTSAPESSSTSALIGALTPLPGLRASAMRDTSQYNLSYLTIFIH